MSRVYEALKRSERHRGEEPFGNGAKPQVAPVSHEADTIRCESEGAQEPVSDAVPPLEGPAEPRGAPFPKGQRRGPRLVVGSAQYSNAVEQFHLLSLRVRAWTIERNERVFAFTSALSGEGKSFVVLNLGASLATLASPVLLIDADLRIPSLHHAFGIVRTKGLADYLVDDAAFEECLHATALPNLIFVPAGRATSTPTELLAGPQMRRFVEKARSIASDLVVLIDSPAAAAVPEPQILGRVADAVVIVVAANRTPRELVKRTIDKAAGATIFGIVLNRFEPPRSAVSYYAERYAPRRT